MSINKEKLERKFAEEYERLNEKQRLAVNTIEGPVMVIAGPGTGNEYSHLLDDRNNTG